MTLEYFHGDKMTLFDPTAIQLWMSLSTLKRGWRCNSFFSRNISTVNVESKALSEKRGLTGANSK